MDLSEINLADYPHLARPVRWKWGPIDAAFELLGDLPENRLISNVRIVPFVGDRVLVLKMEDGSWDHPGGTREPGEPVIETARRELIEEVGARLISFQPFGLIRCHSLQDSPYRPHMPHPDFFHLVVTADVERFSEPTNPEAEEQKTTEVRRVSLAEAVSCFTTRQDGGLWMADMYRLGAKVRELRGA